MSGCSVQELGRHSGCARFVLTKASRFEHIGELRKVHRTNRNQFMNVSRRRSPGFVVRKRTRSAVVSGIPEDVGDDSGPLGGFPKREPRTYSCIPNEFADVRRTRSLRKGARRPKTT